MTHPFIYSFLILFVCLLKPINDPMAYCSNEEEKKTDRQSNAVQFDFYMLKFIFDNFFFDMQSSNEGGFCFNLLFFLDLDKQWESIWNVDDFNALHDSFWITIMYTLIETGERMKKKEHNKNTNYVSYEYRIYIL